MIYTIWQKKPRAFRCVSRHRKHEVAIESAKRASLRFGLPVEIHVGEERGGDKTLIDVIDDGRVLRFDRDDEES